MSYIIIDWFSPLECLGERESRRRRRTQRSWAFPFVILLSLNPNPNKSWCTPRTRRIWRRGIRDSKKKYMKNQNSEDITRRSYNLQYLRSERQNRWSGRTWRLSFSLFSLRPPFASQLRLSPEKHDLRWLLASPLSCCTDIQSRPGQGKLRRSWSLRI